MRKTTIVLLVLLLIMSCSYVYWWTDLFYTPTFQILAQVRPVATDTIRTGRGRGFTIPILTGSMTYPISFSLNKSLKIKKIRVVSIEEEKTTKYSHSYWELISDKTSEPIQSFFYGQDIRGMKSKTPNSKPDFLSPNTKYRIYISTEKFTTYADFMAVRIPGTEVPPDEEPNN